MVNRKYRTTSKDRYLYKQYIFRSIGGLVPQEIALQVAENQTQEWDNNFQKIHELRQGIRTILINNGISAIEFGVYYAFGTRLYKDIKKMRQAGADTGALTEYANESVSGYANRTGCDPNILTMIATYVMNKT